ncbi:NfeD family protein [Rhodoligotrophos defluvii]|uniref:NfeD family protein n=1 Tax=Rhodoligotrophos defluvii TaxID=2561934 RepID=UPI0010C93B02|nr:NfeD family protein [Rhodoligotrophos defluvii]
MEQLLGGIGFWGWWILAGVLLLLELMMPGVFLIWIGAAAFAVGLIVLVVGIPWQAQLLVFAALAVVAVLIARRYFSGPGAASDQPNLNRRQQGFVGQRYRLDAPITDGRGRLWINDTSWVIKGPDAPAGSWVRVTGTDGMDLLVEREE